MLIPEVIPLMILPNATLFLDAYFRCIFSSLYTAGYYRMFWNQIAYLVWL